MNKVIEQTAQTSCSQKEKRSLEHCLKLERWQGPPHINKIKQYEIVLNFKVSLFIQFVWIKKKKKKSVNEDLSPLIRIFPQNDTAAFNVVLWLTSKTVSYLPSVIIATSLNKESLFFGVINNHPVT